MYSRFGTKVTILQRSDRIAPDLEPNISDVLYKYLTDEEIEIVTGVHIKETYQKNDTKFVSVHKVIIMSTQKYLKQTSY